MSISVLVVDDSETLCLYLKALLEGLGVEKVSYCLDAESALSKMDGMLNEWDAVFVDLHMEGMDGLQLMDKLDDMHYRGGIVVMSALDRRILEFTNDVISKFRLRVLGSIHKPFDETTIAFLIKRIQNFRPNMLPSDHQFLKRKEVQRALLQNRLVPYFQPIVNPELRTIACLECLIRLDVEGKGTVLPSAFISVAERFDLITSMTLSMMDCVLPQYRFFLEKTGSDSALAINLSPVQLMDSSLPDILADRVAQHNIEPSKIIFEIAENEPIRAVEQDKNLNRLRIKGFGLALDDYGAGYTNLRQVKSIPYTQVKLDKQLVQGIRHDKVLAVIAQSVLNITNELGSTLIAEGVENPSDLSRLEAIGIKYFQGYLFCRPKPLGELIRWYHAWSRVVGGGGVEQRERRDR